MALPKKIHTLTLTMILMLIIIIMLTACQQQGDSGQNHKQAADIPVEEPENNSGNIDRSNEVDEMTFAITSPVFKNNEKIPAKYTCQGDDINPPLEITNAPGSAKSLVIVMEDPDAPVGTWDHWVLWNIAPTVKSIGEDSVPAGAVPGKNSWGRTGYGGPCPPTGTHRYVFKLSALDIILSLRQGAGKKELEQAMQGHIIEKAELVGLYKKA